MQLKFLRLRTVALIFLNSQPLYRGLFAVKKFSRLRVLGDSRPELILTLHVRGATLPLSQRPSQTVPLFLKRIRVNPSAAGATTVTVVFEASTVTLRPFSTE